MNHERSFVPSESSFLLGVAVPETVSPPFETRLIHGNMEANSRVTNYVEWETEILPCGIVPGKNGGLVLR